MALGSCSLLAPTEDDLSREYTASTGIGTGAATGGSGSDTDGGAGTGGSGGSAPDGGPCADGYIDLNGDAGDGCEHASEIPTAGLLFWLRADAGVKDADGGVFAWRDVSGSALHAEQGFSARRPTLSPGGLGGLPVLAFDGVDDELILPPGISGLDQGLSIFVIVDPAAKTWSTFLNLGYNDDSLPNLWLGRHDVFDEAIYGLGTGCSGTCGVVTEGGAFAPGFHLLTVVHEPSSAVLRVDGVVRSTAGVRMTMPAGEPRDHNQIGNNQDSDGVSFQGSLGEVIFYRGTADVAAVEGYLTRKWGFRR